MGRFKLTNAVLGLLILPWLVACNEQPDNTSRDNQAVGDATEVLTVYKSPSCGCCEDWLTHMETEGFETNAKNSANLSAVKDRHQIPAEARSCHTAVSAEGYVFEGHVPARYVQQFLDAPPAGAIGLSVPGMPIGSPGMEINDRFMPYHVLLLKEDGSREVYAEVESMEQQ